MTALDRYIRKPFKPLEHPAARAALTVAAAGAVLGASALLVRARTRRTERANPPTGRFIKVQGVHLHYVERGRGEPLVLLHGNGAMGSDFDVAGLMEMAASRYRVIAFDRPGFGYSERPGDRLWTAEAQAALLHEALLRLGVKKAVVLGHSWGAQVALALALNHPGLPTSLVLASGYYFPPVQSEWLPLALPAVPVIGPLLRHTVAPWIGRLLWPFSKQRMFGPSRVTRRFASEYPVWMGLRPSQMQAHAAEAALLVPSAMSMAERYGRIEIPVVLLAGEGDRVVSAVEQTLRLHEALPLSEMHIVPGAGHMIHHVEPEEVMLAIDRAAQAADPQYIEGVAPFGTQSRSDNSNPLHVLRLPVDA